MRIKRNFYLGCLAGISLVLCWSQDKPSSAEKPAALKAQKPLIRMDLVQRKKREAAIATRDLFIPQSSSGPAGAPFPAVEEKKPNLGTEEEKKAVELQEQPLALQYLGYIQAPKKMTALVLFEGKAVAVGEGDEFGPAWKVVKITAGEIEIQGSDGKPRTFALEGERK